MKSKILFPLIPLLAAAALTSAFTLSKPQAPTPKADPNEAPELVGGPWLNTKDGKPVTIQSRHGKVTLVAFWTFGCENCQANFAPYARLLKRYRSKGVELISVHTPETKGEHNLSDVADHVSREGIDYPVLIDNAGANWNKWGVHLWPSLYVVDRNGIVRWHWFGELNWNNSGGEAKIGEVLDQLLSSK